MRLLKYAILGLINRSPITGYDITKELDERIMANFWHAKHSQIYPELKKLLEEGLVEFQVEVQGEKLEKKVYTITKEGKNEFREWLLTDEPIGVTPKDVFRLRTFFSDELPAKDFVKLLYSQLSMHKHKLAYLSDNMAKSYSNVPMVGTLELGDYMVLEGAIMREKNVIDWLNKCLFYHGETKDKKILSDI